MKILYHHRIASKDGQYVHVEEIINALRKLGHTVKVVGPKSIESKRFGSEAGVVDLFKKHIPGIIYELLEFSYCIFAFFKLRNAVKVFNPDIIYERYNLYMPAGVWIKKIYKIPVILEVNSPLFHERSTYHSIKIPFLARWSEKYTWKNADYLLPVTLVLKQYLLSAGVNEKVITVIPNGINDEKYMEIANTNESKNKLGLGDYLVLGFTGFMREWHGLEKVVDIIADNKDKKCFFLIVGDGPARDSIENRAKELGVEALVRVTGIIQRDEIPAYVSSFDIALQPDVVEYASPLKLFEYMALGRAIIAPDSDNIKEILVDHVSALLFNAANQDDMKNKVETLINDDILRDNISRTVRQDIFSKGYTWGNNAKTIVEIANNLTNK